MNDDDGSLFGLGRGSLTVIGAVLVVFGIILFLVAATTLTPASSNPFDFAAIQARMSSAFGTAVVGMILLVVVGAAFRLGLIRTGTCYCASEVLPAISRVLEVVGKVL